MNAKVGVTFGGLAPGRVPSVPSVVITVPVDEQHKALLERLLQSLGSDTPIAALTKRDR